MTQFEQMYHFMKKPWAVIAYIALVILVYYFVDIPLASYFHHLDLRTNFLNFITGLGKVKIYVVLFTLTGLYFRYIGTNPVYEARAWYLLACVVITNLVCFILKVSLGRARPDLLFTSNIFGFYGFKATASYWSLPSGHTTVAVSLASGLGVIFPKYFYAFLAFAFLIVLTRVFLYYHYLSDVMTAFYLCILVVGVLTQYIKRKQYLGKAWIK